MTHGTDYNRIVHCHTGDEHKYRPLDKADGWLLKWCVNCGTLLRMETKEPTKEENVNVFIMVPELTNKYDDGVNNEKE